MLLPVEHAQARLLELATPLPVVDMPLSKAHGRYLAEPLLALRDQPWTDLSAMDGYAIRFADLPGPWTLAGEIAAGAVPGSQPLQAGTAIRIFTGAPMPPGADTVVLQEDVVQDGALIRLECDGPGGKARHVRPRASDFASGSSLLPARTLLGPAQLGLAALAGHGSLKVRPGARVAILSTGDELVLPGAACPPGKLPASNGILLRAMIESVGAQVVSEELIADDLDALSSALRIASVQADVVVTSGGASVGDHDLVRPALEAAGGHIDFWRIAMRPGKPLIVGRAGGALFLGLPGNPVSTMVTASLFLLPLLRHLAGAADPLPRPFALPLGAPLPSTGKRAEYVRARNEDGVIHPLPSQDSAAMQVTALANAFIVRPANAPTAVTGENVPVLNWSSLGLGN